MHLNFGRSCQLPCIGIVPLCTHEYERTCFSTVMLKVTMPFYKAILIFKKCVMFMNYQFNLIIIPD